MFKLHYHAYFFLFLIFLCPKASAQRNTILIKRVHIFKLDKYLGILEDKDHKLNINEVASPEMRNKFHYPGKESPNLGFSKSVFWLRIQIADSLSQRYNWILVNNYFSLEDLTLYNMEKDGDFSEIKAGAIIPISHKAIKTGGFVAHLNFPKDTLTTLYLRVQTGSPVILSLNLMTSQEFINSKIDILFFHGILFGILFLIIAYNSFLYFSVKDKSYLFYVLYVFSYTLFLFCDEGYLSYFFGRIFPRDYYILPGIALIGLGLFWLLLTRDFLSTKKYFPSAYKLLNILAFIPGLIAVMWFFIPLSVLVALFSISDILFFALGMVISVVTLKRGNKLSRFYILALSGTVIGLCVIAMRNSNIVPLNFWTLNALPLGILWETIILSYTLGYRMSALEKRVAERTSELTHRTEELNNLSDHLQTVRENERKYISSEIHDEFGGALSALKMDIFSLEELIGDKKDAIRKYESMISLVNDTIKKVQKISTELRPEILDDLGLIDAIEWYAEEFQKRSGINCNVTIEINDIMLNPELTIDIFRIFQETLTNVMRHSGAKEVYINLGIQEDILSLSVEDNGVGIKDVLINSTKSIGLIGMRERINKWNGSFSIMGRNAGGTIVNVKVPVENM